MGTNTYKLASHVKITLSWKSSANKKAMLDLSAFMLDDDGLLQGLDSVVFYGSQINGNGQYHCLDGSIVLNSHKQSNGVIRQLMQVDLERMASNIRTIALVISLDSNNPKSKFSSAEVSIEHEKGMVCRLPIDYVNEDAVGGIIVGTIFRYGESWRYENEESTFAGGLENPYFRWVSPEIKGDVVPLNRAELLKQQALKRKYENDKKKEQCKKYLDIAIKQKGRGDRDNALMSLNRAFELCQNCDDDELVKEIEKLKKEIPNNIENDAESGKEDFVAKKLDIIRNFIDKGKIDAAQRNLNSLKAQLQKANSPQVIECDVLEKILDGYKKAETSSVITPTRKEDALQNLKAHEYEKAKRLYIKLQDKEMIAACKELKRLSLIVESFSQLYAQNRKRECRRMIGDILTYIKLCKKYSIDCTRVFEIYLIITKSH